MTYEQALDQLKRGQRVTRAGKVYRIFRDGLRDVTVEENSERIFFTDEDRAADDWEAVDAPAVESVADASEAGTIVDASEAETIVDASEAETIVDASEAETIENTLDVLPTGDRE